MEHDIIDPEVTVSDGDPRLNRVRRPYGLIAPVGIDAPLGPLGVLGHARLRVYHLEHVIHHVVELVIVEVDRNP